MAHPDCRWTVGVQVNLWNPLRTCAIPECFCGGVSLWRSAISSVCTFLYLYLYVPLMPSGIIWYQPMGSNALWLGR